MELDPRLLVAIGDVFLNLSAGFLAAAFLVSGTYPRSKQDDWLYVFGHLTAGAGALALGYQLRILGA